MDLSRWNLPKFSRLTESARGFHEFLGEVLEGERSLIQSDENTQTTELNPFNVRDDIDSIESLLPTRGGRLRGETVFEVLAPFFEAGFCFDVSNQAPKSGNASDPTGATCVRLKSMFLMGRVFLPPEAEGTRIEFRLPEMTAHQVLRGRVQPMLKLFRLESVAALKEAAVFAFVARPELVFILICGRPHPWQVGVIERTFLTVTDLLSRDGASHKPASFFKSSLSRGFFK